MRTILFATAAILGMTAGTAMADRAPAKQQELAAVVLTKAQIDPRDGTAARNRLLDERTNRHAAQYAAGGGGGSGGGRYPGADTSHA